VRKNQECSGRVAALLWPSVENEQSRESSCDGNSSIKRAATMLAPEGDQRSLSDFQIVEARLVEARFISRASDHERTSEDRRDIAAMLATSFHARIASRRFRRSSFRSSATDAYAAP
jgi:hypothetical protein